MHLENLPLRKTLRSAGPFRKGVASVTRVSDHSNAPKQVVIDRSGKVVSPSILEVQEFYGDFCRSVQVG